MGWLSYCHRPFGPGIIIIIIVKSNLFSMGAGLHWSCHLSSVLFQLLWKRISSHGHVGEGCGGGLLGDAEFHWCSEQIMLFFWLWAVTSSFHKGSFQHSVKKLQDPGLKHACKSPGWGVSGMWERNLDISVAQSFDRLKQSVYLILCFNYLV